MFRRTLVLFFVLTVLVLFTDGFGAGESFTNSIGINLIHIEQGSFRMGSDLLRDNWDEKPVHNVTISKPFYMSETEITIEQFRQFRPDFQPTGGTEPSVAGVSWYDAVEFCKWLSEKEDIPYRLPTEAEWEYGCRAGTATLYSSGDEAPKEGYANPWGLKNMHTGVREWCWDFYGEYAPGDQVDPVGPEKGLTKIVRGGPLDNGSRDAQRKIFNACSNRGSIAASFGLYLPRELKDEHASGEVKAGLIGTWFEGIDLKTGKGQEVLLNFNDNWINDNRRGRNWSARWRGSIEGPFNGLVTFQMKIAAGGVLNIAGREIINAWEKEGTFTGTMYMTKGRKYPIVVTYKRQGRGSHIKLSWSFSSSELQIVGEEAFSHTATDRAISEGEGKDEKDKRAGAHFIGFRVVQGPMPTTMPGIEQISYSRQGIKKNSGLTKIAPPKDKPYFRKRYLLPTPLENSKNEEIDAVGMHPSFRKHCHSPGLEVCPNGDVLMITYTSYREYEPGVSLIASRLRFGVDQWDMPEKLFDFATVNDHCPMPWTDGRLQPHLNAPVGAKIYFFWGNPKLEGGFPFQWTTSNDNGATWDEVKFPNFITEIHPHSRQPINTALRDKNGTMYLSSDGSGGKSVLWVSKDNGKTWSDPVGRSGGRHTTFALSSDGTTIIGMGGKSTDIDGYMPKSISKDGGKTWDVVKTRFPALGGNQRPIIIRLQSGRLFFAADFQHISGRKPDDITQSGSFVALSDDDGENWHVKKLVGTQQHENPKAHKGAHTIGYSTARQAPNGMIHLITTMNRPCLHFELNEAWILQDEVDIRSEKQLMQPTAKVVSGVKKYQENYPSGKVKTTWYAGKADDGRYLLHGEEKWYYENSHIQREANYNLGRKVKTETYWAPDGTKMWQWHYRDGPYRANTNAAVAASSVWTQYWPNGKKKAESTWRNFKCDGTATLWDLSGNVISSKQFAEGIMLD